MPLLWDTDITTKLFFYPDNLIRFLSYSTNNDMARTNRVYGCPMVLSFACFGWNPWGAHLTSIRKLRIRHGSSKLFSYSHLKSHQINLLFSYTTISCIKVFCATLAQTTLIAERTVHQLRLLQRCYHERNSTFLRCTHDLFGFAANPHFHPLTSGLRLNTQSF